MLGQLVPCGGGPPIPLLKPKLLVGRNTACDIALADSSVSSRHCQLEFINGCWFVRDLGSSNGTRVNGKIWVSQRLLQGDILAVARCRFTVLYGSIGDRLPLQAIAPRTESKGSPERKATAPDPAARPVEHKGQETQPSSPALGELISCGGGDPIPLLKTRLLIGRATDCDIVLRFPTVSVRHCLLEWTDGTWVVRDLGSRNGIRVEGVRCEAKSLLPGNVFWVANLRYRIDYTLQGSGAGQKPPLFTQSLLEKAGLTQAPIGPSPGSKRKPGDEEEPPRRRYTLDDR
jgi:pSer/pThr/pTyr-binding forkhead associated (FHA) protein